MKLIYASIQTWSEVFRQCLNSFFSSGSVQLPYSPNSGWQYLYFSWCLERALCSIQTYEVNFLNCCFQFQTLSEHYKGQIHHRRLVHWAQDMVHIRRISLKNVTHCCLHVERLYRKVGTRQFIQHNIHAITFMKLVLCWTVSDSCWLGICDLFWLWRQCWRETIYYIILY